MLNWNDSTRKVEQLYSGDFGRTILSYSDLSSEISQHLSVGPDVDFRKIIPYHKLHVVKLKARNEY